MKRLNEALQHLAGQGHFSSAPHPPEVEAVPVAPVSEPPAAAAEDQVQTSIQLAGQLAELMEQIGDSRDPSLPLQVHESALAGFVESTETNTVAPVVVDTMPVLSSVTSSDSEPVDGDDGEAQALEAVTESVPRASSDTATRIDELRVELGILTREERRKSQAEDDRCLSVADKEHVPVREEVSDEPERETVQKDGGAVNAEPPEISGGDPDEIKDEHQASADADSTPDCEASAAIADEDQLDELRPESGETALVNHRSERPVCEEPSEPVVEASPVAAGETEPYEVEERDGGEPASVPVEEDSLTTPDTESNQSHESGQLNGNETTTHWEPPLPAIMADEGPHEAGESLEDCHLSLVDEAPLAAISLDSSEPDDEPEPQAMSPTMVLPNAPAAEPTEPEASPLADSADAVLKLVEQVLGLQPATLSSSTPVDSIAAESSPVAATDSPAEPVAEAVQTDPTAPDSDPAWEPPPPKDLDRGDSAYQPVLGTWAVVSPAAAPSPNTTEATEHLAAEAETVAEPAAFAGSLEHAEEAASNPATIPESGRNHNEDATMPMLSAPALHSIRPTEYETDMAQRILQGDYGSRIKQLNDQIIDLEGNQPKAVLLVATDAGDQCANPAVGLGMYRCGGQELPTLILDANLASNHISRHFEQQEGPGFIEAVAGDLAWPGVVRHTSCEKLQLIPGGGVAEGQFALDRLPDLAARSARLVHQLKEQYGMIIMDGGHVDSPLIPSLSRAADATFVCVRLGVSRREDLVAAIERLHRAGGKIAGCITTADS